METIAKARLEQLLSEGAAMGASHVFLAPGEPLTVRVDGQIRRTEGEILTAADIDEMAVAAFGQDRMELFRKDFIMPQCMWSPGGEVPYYERLAKPVRMNMVRSCGQHMICAWLSTPEIVDVGQLRVPEAILQAALSTSGFILFSGRWGWNPETTAYSVMDYINSNRACDIRTTENPIYARFTPKKALIQQCEIGGDAPSAQWVFRSGMTTGIDVFFVSELTDLEACEACFAAAESGRLAIAVMHMPDRPHWAIDRLIEAFPVDQQHLFARLISRQLRAVCCPRPLAGAHGGYVTAYATLIPDAEMRKAIADGRDPMQRESPMPPECQMMEQAIQRLLDDGEITAETAQKALAELQ